MSRTHASKNRRSRAGVALLSVRESVGIQIEAALRYCGEFRFLGRFKDADALRRRHPARDIALCLFDLHLAGPDAHWTRLQTIFPHLSCVLLTHEHQEKLALELLLRGAHGCLDLQTQADSITHLLRDIQQGGSSIPPRLATPILRLARQHRVRAAGSDNLSRREKQVIALLAEGALYKEIAGQLHISLDTVRRHITNIYNKLGVRSRTHAVLKYLRHERRGI